MLVKQNTFLGDTDVFHFMYLKVKEKTFGRQPLHSAVLYLMRKEKRKEKFTFSEFIKVKVSLKMLYCLKDSKKKHKKILNISYLKNFFFQNLLKNIVWG